MARAWFYRSYGVNPYRVKRECEIQIAAERWAKHYDLHWEYQAAPPDAELLVSGAVPAMHNFLVALQIEGYLCGQCVDLNPEESEADLIRVEPWMSIPPLAVKIEEDPHEIPHPGNPKGR